MDKHQKFSRFAWIVFIYNLFVIAWGAYVRATGSGAGCGAHWPLCNGEVIPRSPRIETIIEFSHRISSGFTLILVIILVIWAWRIYTRGNLVRKAAIFALVFTISEALVGAGLVLFELVAHNASITRAFSMIVHLINTFLLLGALILTAWWSTVKIPEKLSWPGTPGIILGIGLLGLLILGASGAVTALGDTLFPSTSLAEGIQQDLSPTAHFLVRLRVFHPIIATSVGVYLFVGIFWLRRRFKNPTFLKLTALSISLFSLQLILGATNVILLAPVWLQMVHLIVSDLIWASLVLAAEFTLTHPLLLEGSANEGIKVAVKYGASKDSKQNVQ